MEDLREQRGIVLAATKRIQQHGDCWRSSFDTFAADSHEGIAVDYFEKPDPI